MFERYLFVTHLTKLIASNTRGSTSSLLFDPHVPCLYIIIKKMPVSSRETPPGALIAVASAIRPRAFYNAQAGRVPRCNGGAHQLAMGR